VSDLVTTAGRQGSALTSRRREMDASIGLAQTSALHWLRVSGLLVMLMIVGAVWTSDGSSFSRKNPRTPQFTDPITDRRMRPS